MSGRREGLDPDLALSLELKSVVSSPNKRKKKLEALVPQRGKNWAWIQGKRILLLSYEVLRKKFGYLSSGQALWKYQVYLRGSPPPDNLGRGWFFCVKSPTLGDKLLSNFPRGKGGAIGRGSFHTKVLVLFIKNGHLPLQLIKKNTVEMQEDFLKKFCSYVCYFTDISGSLKILDNISVILSTKVRKITIHLLAFHPLQTLGAAKGLITW